jgi:hypothetical protein
MVAYICLTNSRLANDVYLKSWNRIGVFWKLPIGTEMAIYETIK